MPNGIYSAMTGALAQEEHMDILANNLANGSTNGFKGVQATFKELMDEAREGTQNETQRHVVLDSTFTDFSQGPLQHTHNKLDVAIQGEGFFVVDTPEGPAYTRNGAFMLNDQRQLTTVSGEVVQGTSGPIEIPEGAVVNINQSGAVTSGALEIGKIRVVKFEDPQSLNRIGHNLYGAPDGVDAVDLEQVAVQTGAIERSNVNMIREMTSLIKVSRFYDSFNKAIQTYRTVDSTTARELGR